MNLKLLVKEWNKNELKRFKLKWNHNLNKNITIINKYKVNLNEFKLLYT